MAFNIVDFLEIYDSTRVLDPKYWPDEFDDLLKYGKKEIRFLYQWFRDPLENLYDTDEITVLSQWRTLNAMISTTQAWEGIHPNCIYQKIHNMERHDFGDVAAQVSPLV